MKDLVGGTPGEPLPLDAYLGDFEQRFWTIGDQGFWKLERQQTFKEPGYASWESFAAGRWEEALQLLDQEREGLKEYFGQLAERGISFRRVRVVEEPIAPYLQWELNVLRVREQCGEEIRVIGPEKLAALEAQGEVPELVTLGEEAMYQIVYDAEGILEGAIRFADRDIITKCRQTIEHLYAEGEELGEFFERAVADLQPPQGE